MARTHRGSIVPTPVFALESLGPDILWFLKNYEIEHDEKYIFMPLD